MTQRHIVSVTFTAKPDQIADVLTAMQSVQRDLPKGDGCDAVRVMRAHDRPAVFMLLEDWRRAAQHASHIGGLVASGAWAALEAILDKAPDTDVLGDLAAA